MLLSSVCTLGHKWDYILFSTPLLSILSNDIILMCVYLHGTKDRTAINIFLFLHTGTEHDNFPLYARIQFRLIMLLVLLLLSHHLNVIIIIIMFENIPYLEINRKKNKKLI